MLLIEANNIKKSFADRLILDVESLKIYSEDRIGIVGVNGVGKTTLINILSKRLEADEGYVKIYSNYSYISQLEGPECLKISKEMASKFNIRDTWYDNMSGGEKTRFKLAQALSENSPLVFADEPTSNIDIEGIELLERSFQEYKGALVLISHDRSFLDKLCNKIIELEGGKIKIYKGNYSDYIEQKAKARERAKFEYEEYIKEKKRLQQVIIDTKQKIKSMRKTPKRMGNSEARLHKMGNQKAKANLDKNVKAVEKRIEHLESKEKPKEQELIKLDIKESNKLFSKIVIEGKNISKRFGDKVIFNDTEFSIFNGSKVALIGPNGCGKSTLIKMIMNNEDFINLSKGAKIGYFSQDMSILNDDLTIIENVMEESIYDETFARILLAGLFIKKEDIYKKVGVLSGGEKVKVSFAKMLLKDINLLILDEPTNYIDINSLEVVEKVLKDYEGTILFVSHDRRFIEAVADTIMTIENHKINIFRGNYKEYLASKRKVKKDSKQDIKNQIFILQNRITEVIGRLSIPSKNDNLEELDKEYKELLAKLKELKSKV
ncbi:MULTISPECIES: ribosomal protection-like ABC-F family protein [Eubacteriales]|uniref:ABC transporter n=1 Tax=Clostridium isatidis TaxID=182773 RepID=A0A343J943_9CLOT|nr:MULTISPECIES: ABC-F type ribosomal protection protein [Eubacteriales]ASW42051.1 ABC transporter [Clostridium isatidis]MBU5454698.1 ABC-F type ribosomal protection protein [Caproiciproducens sp. MSJ-32]NLZ34398.1 ABC-F type ribosomal protection protein [Clostridiales bacterium]